MKVVLFCGGLGTRLREHSDTIPKPLVSIGYRPLLWHLMKYYAHFGHKEFILCLGYKGDMIKEFFLNYNECLSNDFVMSNGGKDIRLFSSDIHDWKITFVETGLHANIGQRLLAVRRHLEHDELFLANYSDGLSDLPFGEYLETCRKKDVIANFVGVRTPQSFHAVHSDADSMVVNFGQVSETEFWVNGGYFVFKNAIFDYIEEGDELVEAPFRRLMAERQLHCYRYRGFWRAMDTFKDKIDFDRMFARGHSPWQVWNSIAP
jgi:glucose-1-phosphate cytidylyltransferase